MVKLDEVKVIESYKRTKSLRETAEEFGSNSGSVSYLLKRNGISISNSVAPKTAITKEEIQDLLNSGHKMAHIARKEGVSTVIIKRILNGETKSRNKNEVDKHSVSPDSVKAKIGYGELKSLVEYGLNDTQIAEKYNVSRESICQLRLSYGINKSTGGRPILTDGLLTTYFNNGTSDNDIHKVTGWSLSTIKHHRQEAGLLTKKLWETIEVTDYLKSIIFGIYLGDAYISKMMINYLNNHIYNMDMRLIKVIMFV